MQVGLKKKTSYFVVDEAGQRLHFEQVHVVRHNLQNVDVRLLVVPEERFELFRKETREFLLTYFNAVCGSCFISL